MLLKFLFNAAAVLLAANIMLQSYHQGYFYVATVDVAVADVAAAAVVDHETAVTKVMSYIVHLFRSAARI